MTNYPPNQILYPMFAMYALVAYVLLRMRSRRFAAVRTNRVPASYYKTYSTNEEPEELQVIARHFSNLFEVPVLFYVVVLTTYVTGQVTYVFVALAWLYVALRYVHSYIHLTSNHLIARFSVYFASGFVLTIHWALLFVRLIRVG
jgi:hypothetical protein